MTIKLYEQLVRKNGKYRQMCVYRSELFELMTEVTKFVYNDSKKDTIYQEIADMIICTEQFIMYHFHDRIFENLDIIKEFYDIFNNENVSLETKKPVEDIMSEIEKYFTRIHGYLNTVVNIGPLPDDKILNSYEILNVIGVQCLFESWKEYCSDVLNFLASIIELLTNNDAYNNKYVELSYDYKLSRLNLRFSDNKYI